VGDDGIASFDRLRHWHHDAEAFLWAFDLIELNGDDLRSKSLDQRKASLARMVATAASGLQLNEHMQGHGPSVFEVVALHISLINVR
jgi:bifunctional non-homologous end joining protein LigD